MSKPEEDNFFITSGIGKGELPKFQFQQPLEKFAEEDRGELTGDEAAALMASRVDAASRGSAMGQVAVNESFGLPLAVLDSSRLNSSRSVPTLNSSRAPDSSRRGSKLDTARSNISKMSALSGSEPASARSRRVSAELFNFEVPKFVADAEDGIDTLDLEEGKKEDKDSESKADESTAGACVNGL